MSTEEEEKFGEQEEVEQEEVEEQITKIPDDLEKKPLRVKDPKKVKAGKALHHKNMEAREALKKQGEGLSLADVASNIRNVGFTVGAGFTIYHGFRFLFPKEEKHEAVETNTIKEEPEPEPEPTKEKTNIDMD